MVLAARLPGPLISFYAIYPTCDQNLTEALRKDTMELESIGKKTNLFTGRLKPSGFCMPLRSYISKICRFLML
jgi:hypothetical protein